MVLLFKLKYMSKRFELNKTDIQKIIRNIAIIYWPVGLLFLEQIQKWEFDYKILLALVISTSIDVARRYLTDYTK